MLKIVFYSLLLLLVSCQNQTEIDVSEDFMQDELISDFLLSVEKMTSSNENDIQLFSDVIETATRIEDQYDLSKNRKLISFLESEIMSIIEKPRLDYQRRASIAFGTSDTLYFSSQEIWEVLVDIENYRDWNPFTISVRTTFELGSPIKMKVRLLPFLTINQPETIAVFDPIQDMCWSSMIISEAIFSSFRCRSLVSIEESSTVYSNTMVYDGLIAPLVNAFTGSLVNNGFVQETRGLNDYLMNKE